MNVASYVVGGQSPSYARLLSVNAIQQSGAVNLAGGAEYSLARWTITNTKTVGTGACAGCDVPVCVTLSQIRVCPSSPEPCEDISQPLVQNAIGWQCATFIPGNRDMNPQCLAPIAPCSTPVGNRTWGGIKSLYR